MQAFRRLLIILFIISLYAIFQTNYWNTKNYKLNHPKTGIKKQIADSEDKIRSLNSELSKWKSESNMTYEAMKLKFRKIQESEKDTIEYETDS